MLIYKSLIIRRKNDTNILQAIPQKRRKERVAIAWTIKKALDNTLSHYITIPSHNSFCNIIRNSHFSLSSGKMHSNFYLFLYSWSLDTALLGRSAGFEVTKDLKDILRQSQVRKDFPEALFYKEFDVG